MSKTIILAMTSLMNSKLQLIVITSNLTLADNITGLSTRQSLTPVEDSHLSVPVVNKDFSSIENDRITAIMENICDVFGDVSFDFEAKNKSVHKIETSEEQVFTERRKLTP